MNVKVGYDIAPALQATYTVALMTKDQTTTAETYLRDAAGNSVRTGNVVINGLQYNLNSVSWQPTKLYETTLLNGASLKSDTGGTWDFEAAVSNTTFLENYNRVGSKTDWSETAAGTVTYTDGSGWTNADLRGIWRPDGHKDGEHEVSFGYHVDQYNLNSTVYATNGSWKANHGDRVTSAQEGSTRTQALYIQDVWNFAPDWTLTVGGRGEFWQAFDGMNQNSSGSRAYYDDRSAKRFSPKAALSWQMTPEINHRLSVGKAYRFPTVGEMFQAVTTGTALTENNPGLKPENVNAVEWATEYTVGRNRVRGSLFLEQRQDALVSQTSTFNGGSSKTYYQNYEEAMVKGVELVAESRGLIHPDFDLRGSLTYVDSEITKNQARNQAEGHPLPYIARWRANLMGTYRPSQDLSLSVSGRFLHDLSSTDDGSDVNYDENGYGMGDTHLVFDTRANYKVTENVTLSAGIDNLFNEEYWGGHPYSMRTFFTEMRFDF